jgi:hypothetical protein
MTDLVEDIAGNKAQFSMERSEDISQLMTALAKAQGEIGEIPRNKTVTVRPKSGGLEYTFKYASLDAILNAIKKPLSDNGIARTQVLSHDADGGFFVLTTSLYCGNQFISSKVPLIAAEGSNQQFGSALTYMKRYALAAMLGLAADEDDDGNAADGNVVIAAKDKTPKVVAPDPISSGGAQAQPNLDKVAGETSFSPVKIEVPLLADESGSDWMAWGQAFISVARQAPNVPLLGDLEYANDAPLKTMQQQAPKMYTNMTLALLKVRKALEKSNG